ncbi:hypothetical protein [Streptomyces flaveus]|uniref:Ribbon-helix-helix protein CopG domain-containing protein n=1 Tax=Streptomyces flaveus TaxID=66370 RepID=A0A917QFV2_9ACTN|nr:hypothetical protein [Streptomyces flaveus]GGK48591.1 hypothetical protein GCM10010094_06060 [Streptomyces flaveus]
MKELTIRLDASLRQALDDLADAQGRPPEELAEKAVRGYLHAEGRLVRALAERIAKEHAELLRRLGE